MTTLLQHRLEGYGLLSGQGLEIGALHYPAPLPADCTVEYCDVISTEEARRLFPEISHYPLAPVSHIVDLDTECLSPFVDESYDFLVFNHVIEHIANPIRVLEDIFRIVKYEGLVVISAPDKRFTFDKDRKLTPFEHLYEEYKNQETSVSSEHYLDLLEALEPELVQSLDHSLIEAKLDLLKSRREHAHVWDSDTFRDFLLRSFANLNIFAVSLYESQAHNNNFEYFGVWQKSDESSMLILDQLGLLTS